MGIVTDTILSYISNRKRELPPLEEVIYVTDLTGCRRRAELRRAFPQLDLQTPRRLVGSFIHDGFMQFVEVYFEDAQFEVEAEKRFSFGLLRGRADVVLGDQVWEIKFTTSAPSPEPFRNHRDQLFLYMNLLGKSVGRLIYLSPDRILEYQYHVEVGDDFAELLYNNWTSPKYDWECFGCPYRHYCELVET